MSRTLQEMVWPAEIRVPLSHLIFAQESAPNNQFQDTLQRLNLNVGQTNLWNIGLAIGILILGFLVALLAGWAIGGLLKRTNIDNRLAGWVTGRPDGPDAPPVEKWISTAVFWLVFIFFLVAFFNQLNLTAVSVPLNTFLNQVTGFLPSLAGALIWLGIAWVIATVAKLAVLRGLRAVGLDERLNQEVGTTATDSPLLLSDTLANALYWFIFLLFLPVILDTLQLQQAITPVENLLNQILAAIPKILKAIIVAGLGWLLAQIVRRLVTNLLAATGADNLGARFGLSRTIPNQSLSWIIGTIVYVLILIPTAVEALNALEIDAISVPATAMLNNILAVIPNIFTAALVLIVGYVLGRFVADLVTNILTSIGFNHIFQWLGLQDVTSPRPVVEPLSSQDTVIQEPTVPARTPSEFVGIIVLVGILLFAAVTATNILGIEALTVIVGGLIVIAGRVLAGLVVFAIGLYFANLAYNLIASSGTRQSQFLGNAARIAIIALVAAMALQQMGIASDIVNLAFGLLLGAIAVAIALAFGLGGRDIAAEQIRQWLAEFKQQRPPRL